jgi:hypothetical protein
VQVVHEKHEQQSAAASKEVKSSEEQKLKERDRINDEPESEDKITISPKPSTQDVKAVGSAQPAPRPQKIDDHHGDTDLKSA